MANQPTLQNIWDAVSLLVKENGISKKRYLKQQEAIRYTGIGSVSTLNKWERLGLPRIKINGVVLYDKKDLDAFILKFKN